LFRAGGTYNSGEIHDFISSVNSKISKGYDIQIAVYPGLAYNVSKKLQLEAGFNNLGYLQFSHSKQTATNWSAVTNNFSAGSSLSNFSGLTVGFRILPG
jgi:outer membrane receptor for ferrienterochelin and colicin